MNAFLAGSIAGAIGVGYFAYGKKQAKTVPMICGVLLMAYPYFFDNAWLVVAIGIVLCLVPAFFRD